jgi:hypothetical protein
VSVYVCERDREGVVNNRGAGKERDRGQFSLRLSVAWMWEKCLAEVGVRKLGLEAFSTKETGERGKNNFNVGLDKCSLLDMEM